MTTFECSLVRAAVLAAWAVLVAGPAAGTEPAPGASAGEEALAAALQSKGAEIAQTSGTVTGVSMRDCARLTADDFASLRQFPKLRQVSLGVGANDETLRALGALPALEVLATNGLDVSDRGVRLLTRHKQLKTLALFHPGRNFSGVTLDALAELPQFESLTVAGSLGFGDEGMAAVAKLTGLKQFRTWHTAVTRKGVLQLARLEKLTNLTLGQHLSLERPTTLADDCLPIIAGLPSLEALCLQEARLTLPALSQLKGLPKLKRLTLDGVEISADDLAALKQHLPGIDIRWTEPSDAFRKRIDAKFGPGPASSR